MDTRRAWLRLTAVAALAVAVAPACGQIGVTGQGEASGAIESVGDGMIEVRAAGGELLTLRVQAPGEGSVPLSTGQRLAFSADVLVRTELPIASLEPGQWLRLRAELNRRGEAAGEIAEVSVLPTAEGESAPAISPERDAESLAQHVPCVVVGRFVRLARGRLMIKVARNSFCRKKSLRLKVGGGCVVRGESDDYRSAAGGAAVESVRFLRLSTGDAVVKSLRVLVTEAVEAEMTFEQELLEKHRELSDEPSPPRLVRSQHFMLQTDVSDRNAAVLLDKLERMVRLLSAYFGRKPTGLIRGYVVRDLSQWPEGSLPEPQGVAKIREGAGVCFSTALGSRRQATVYSAADHGVMQHESTHAFCTMAFGSTGPTWLAEGVAELGQYWREGATDVRLPPVVLRYLQQASPKKTLAEIAVPGRTPAGAWQDYAWRWALCHLLANNPNYADRFRPLAVGLMTKRPGATFAAVYGPVRNEISFEYDQFLEHLTNGYDASRCAWEWGRKSAPLREGRTKRVAVAADRGWQATGVRVEAGGRLGVAAEGAWRLAPAGAELSAAGEAGGRGTLLAAVLSRDPQTGAYTLSEVAEVGGLTSFTPPATGDVYLRCNDAWQSLADNAGEVNVTLTGAAR